MDLKRRIPTYLMDAEHVVSAVLFTVLFSIVFLLVFLPFDPLSWFTLGRSPLLVHTVVFFAVSILFVVLSKWIFLNVGRNRGVSWVQLIIWDLAESVAIAVFYTALTYAIDRKGLLDISLDSYRVVFGRAMLISFMGVYVPYLFSTLFYAMEDKDDTIRLMNYGNVVSDSRTAPQDLEKVTLFGDDGLLKMSINLKNLYYIESDDNYIKVWYSDVSGETRQYMLRCRLKTVEESFAGSQLVRCHRKYIVNLMRVELLLREKDGYYVKLDLPGCEPIPISKTYEQTMISRFNSR